MLHASTQKLIVKLCELTEANEIAWKEGPRDTSVFESEGYAVEVTGSPPTLRLLCSDGRELERADEADLAMQPWPDGEGTFASHVVTLASSASRLARGAEVAISRILSSLSAPPKKAVIVEPSPSPHTPPPLPEPESREADSAIERVLAVQPVVVDQPAPEPEEPALAIAESDATAMVSEPIAAESPESGVGAAPEPLPEPIIAESEATAVIVEAAPAAAESAIEVEPEAEPRRRLIAEAESDSAVPEPQPEPVATVVEPPPSEPARRPTTFGATPSFANARPAEKPTEPPQAPIGSILGLNTTSRPVRAEPQPQPLPRPAAKPVPATAEPERMPEPVGPDADVYKPWS